ncbi:MAG TPA: ABC transporter substrate-binding protein [Casimicrobiaceae bacterium]|nr:ABC transporter substrate-binding protein [Casimicrobiaceae bacterium]
MTLRRRKFLLATGAVLLGTSWHADAQRAGRMPRIGFLTPGLRTPTEPAFWQGMRDLGYIEGKTISVDRRSAEGDFTRLPTLAEELVKLRPDVIVVLFSAAAIAAQQATATIPIVMVDVSDPIASGLVANLARPGGNLSGTASQSNATVSKEVELIRQLLPSATRVAALWNPANAIFQQLMLSEALAAGARLHILVRIGEVRTREELDRAFAALGQERPDAVLILQDLMFNANAARVAELALTQRLPVISGSQVMAEAGIVASYGSDLALIARRSAFYVQKILGGAKPGDLAVELPTKFELVINVKTAKALGMTVPAAVLARADEVIR